MAKGKGDGLRLISGTILALCSFLGWKIGLGASGERQVGGGAVSEVPSIADTEFWRLRSFSLIPSIFGFSWSQHGVVVVVPGVEAVQDLGRGMVAVVLRCWLARF